MSHPAIKPVGPETPEDLDALILPFPRRCALEDMPSFGPCVVCGRNDEEHHIWRGDLTTGEAVRTLVSCADLLDLDARLEFARLPWWSRLLSRRPEGWKHR
jgi:hypothetical protein